MCAEYKNLLHLCKAIVIQQQEIDSDQKTCFGAYFQNKPERYELCSQFVRDNYTVKKLLNNFNVQKADFAAQNHEKYVLEEMPNKYHLT